MRHNEFTLLLLLFLISILLFIFALYFHINVLAPFLEERKFIKNELSRTSGNEHAYWKKHLKRLYIKNIPLIGKFLAKRWK